MNSFYIDTFSFQRWGTEHTSVFIFGFLLCILFFYKGINTWSLAQKTQYSLWLCTAMIFWQLFKTLFKMAYGNFNIAEDLPLQLCNLMPFALYYAYHTHSRQIWAIFLFWILLGSSQSLFTPTLTEVLPHYDAIRYWLVHFGIVLLTFFGFFAMGWRLKYSDIWKSGLTMNISALFIYGINIALSSNYFFLNAKPPGKTFYSLLPDWPIYILWLELVWVLGFHTIYFIFKGLEKFTIKKK